MKILKSSIIIFLIIIICIIPITAQASDCDKYADYLDHDQTMNDNTRYYDIDLEPMYQKLIFELCEEHNFYYESILAWIFIESSYNYTAINYNSRSSYDVGLTQINSKYLWWYEELAREYGLINEPLVFTSPTHQIELGIAGLIFYREFWYDTGLSTDEIFIATFNSYNMGVQQYIDWCIANGTSRRYYDKNIVEYMRELESQTEK